MKKTPTPNPQNHRRLAITKQTIRCLTQADLSHVNAGCDTTSLTTERGLAQDSRR